MTLTPAHLAFLLTTLASFFTIPWILFDQTLTRLYLQENVFPRLEHEYGFQGGNVAFTGPGATWHRWGIVQLIPDGELEALGLRRRDVPAGPQDGPASMYDALTHADRKRFAAFHVINADVWNAGHFDAGRTIVAYPRRTDRPMDFGRPYGRELISPSVQFGLLVMEGAASRYDLVLRHYASAETMRIYTYQSDVSAVWSTDESWVAVTDHDDIHTSRCILVNVRTGARTNVANLAARLPAFARDLRTGEQLSCDVFGWVRGTSRVAVRLWERRVAASGSYFLDTARWTLSDSRAH